MANIVNMVTGKVYVRCGHIALGVCNACFMRMYNAKEQEIVQLKAAIKRGG